MRGRQVGHGKEAIAPAHIHPRTGWRARRTRRLAGSAPAAVVLQAAAQAIWRLHVVGHVIELRERNVVQHVEGLPAVMRDLKPAVIGAEHAQGLVGSIHMP